MARTVLLVVTLALVGLGAWLVLRSDAAGRIAGEAAAAESGARASAASESAPEAERTRVAVAPEATASSAPSIPSDAKWLDVLVVDKASGEPVPDAEVAWSDGTTFERLPVAEQNVWLGRDPERIARDHGWRTASDEHGRARVHQGDFTQVFARKQGRFGQATANKRSPPPSPLRIELVEDRTVLAKVLDAAGNPTAGVPVAIALHGADGAFLRVLSSNPVTQSKAPDGLARVAHLQELRDRPSGNQVWVPAAEWRVRACLPGYADPGIAFDANAPPAEPIVLRLPATCSVAVHVELQGRIVPIAGNVHLSVAGAPGARAEVPDPQVPVDAEGIARFPYVPLEGTLLLSAHLLPSYVKKELSGPRSAGQRLDVVLDVPPDDIVLTGRLLADGQPLRKSSVSVDFKSSQWSGSMNMPTDADGRFRFFLGQAREKSNIERFVLSLWWKDRTPLRASLAPRELHAGVQDVGDLVLEPGPLVVAGRFLSGLQPYEGNVGFFVERAEPPRERDGHVDWEQVQGLTTAQSRGAFEARGEVAPGRYRIVFPSYDHLPVVPLEFALGAKDLAVQVERGVTVTGKLAMPPAMPSGVQAVLRPNDRGSQPREDVVPKLYSHDDRQAAEPYEQSPGRYLLRWRPMKPGSYTLELRLWAWPEPLLTVPDVAVPLRDGDRRLAELDLHGKVEALTLRIRGVEAKPEAGRGSVLVFPMPQDPAADWRAFGVSGDVPRLAVPARPVDLLVATEAGHRPVEVRSARGEAEVRLEPWPRTELVFEGLEAALPTGTRLVARIEAATKPAPGRYVTPGSSGGRDWLLEPRQANEPIERGRARLALGTGPQRLVVYLAQEGSRWRRLEGVTPAEVRTSTEPVVVGVPPESLQKAIAEVQAASEGKK